MGIVVVVEVVVDLMPLQAPEMPVAGAAIPIKQTPCQFQIAPNNSLLLANYAAPQNNSRKIANSRLPRSAHSTTYARSRNLFPREKKAGQILRIGELSRRRNDPSFFQSARIDSEMLIHRPATRLGQGRKQQPKPTIQDAQLL
ncbi:MAG: hypothetical protein NTW21_20075 [Verrucomicrobia bacterium]|nr:hypothetical protein [Verrucomicrobiota bacterium]